MDPNSAPLADYFWIAGIDSLSFNDKASKTSAISRDKSPNGAATSPPIETTIEEGSEIEITDPIIGSAPRPTARHSRNNSWQRLSRLSNDARNSIGSVELIENPNSNRSSVTIRAAPASSINGTNNRDDLGAFDFDKALSKFASERDSFLEDLRFSAGTVLQSRPPMTSKVERLRHDDSDINGRKSPFGKVGGSIRRKISFRDLNSMKRQNTISRASESRIYIILSKFQKLRNKMAHIGRLYGAVREFSLAVKKYSTSRKCYVAFIRFSFFINLQSLMLNYFIHAIRSRKLKITVYCAQPRSEPPDD